MVLSFYGVDAPQKSQLIAAQQKLDEIRTFFGTGSLAYLISLGIFFLCLPFIFQNCNEGFRAPDSVASVLSTSSSSSSSVIPASGVDPANPNNDPPTPPVRPPSNFNLNPKLVGLKENTWMVLEKNGIEIDGHTAYSGGTFDRTNHQFLIFCGGHRDGWRNDILAFDIASGKWKGMYIPDPESTYNCGNVNSKTPGMLAKTKMPASRHTYDQIDFIEHVGKMIVWSGVTYSGTWDCNGEHIIPPDTWLYDYHTNKWEYKNKARGLQPADEAMSGAYDPIGKLYWALGRYTTYGQTEFWNYDADTDKWTLVKPKGHIPDGSVMIVDRKRQILHQYPNFYDIKANQWSTLKNTPSGLSDEYSGFASSYDEVNDALVHVSNGKVFVYHIDRDEWETLSPSGTPSIDASVVSLK
ncbi:MAG: hypothetical protein ACREYE_23130 [Gammaproteobacteria bacterium]